jgi:hypothetical protein
LKNTIDFHSCELIFFKLLFPIEIFLSIGEEICDTFFLPYMILRIFLLGYAVLDIG